MTEELKQETEQEATQEPKQEVEQTTAQEAPAATQESVAKVATPTPVSAKEPVAAAESQAVTPAKTIKKRNPSDRNTVFIGSKPFMNYVTAVVMQFTTQNSGTVSVKSRGKFVSKAVDVAEVVKRRFMSGQIDVAGVEIGSESFENKEGRQVSVSTIDIKLAKI